MAENIERGEDEATDYAVADDFTSKCKDCGGDVAVIQGVPQAHTCKNVE